METFCGKKSKHLSYRLKTVSPLRLIAMCRSRVRKVKYSLNDNKC